MYSLDSHTTVISVFFEMVIRRTVVKCANSEELQLEQPMKQIHCSDFTPVQDHNEKHKKAVAGKTWFSCTLEGCTSYVNQKRKISFKITGML